MSNKYRVTSLFRILEKYLKKMMIFGSNLRLNLGYQKSISKKFCFLAII